MSALRPGTTVLPTGGRPAPPRPARGAARRGRRRSSAAVGGLVGFGLVLVLLAELFAAGGLTRSTAPEGLTVAGLDAYLAELEPATKDAAFVVMHGLRAGITDVGQSRYGDPVLRDMTDGWQAELTAVRARLAAVEAPAPLAAVHADLLAAMDAYLGVARTLATAVASAPGEREGIAREAAAQGEAADDTWDRGAQVLQTESRRLGLGAVTWLPDPATREVEE